MDQATAATAVESQVPAIDGNLKTLVNIFLAPTRAFITLAVTRRWLLPLLLCAICAVAYEATTSRYRMADLKDRISHDPTLSQEEVSRRLGNIEAQRTTTISYRQLSLGATMLTVVQVIKTLALAGVLWLAVQFFPNVATYGKLFSASAFIFLATVPEQIFKALLIIAKGSYQVYLGPAALLPAEWHGSPLFLALDRLDFFSLWMAVLMAIALPILTGISKGKAAFTVGCLWVIWALLAMLPVRLIQID
jgi:hypothetical protein